ncbi:unnamed protein product, partial [Prorocentrum cordatum]
MAPGPGTRQDRPLRRRLRRAALRLPAPPAPAAPRGLRAWPADGGGDRREAPAPPRGAAGHPGGPWRGADGPGRPAAAVPWRPCLRLSPPPASREKPESMISLRHWPPFLSDGTGPHGARHEDFEAWHAELAVARKAARLRRRAHRAEARSAVAEVRGAEAWEREHLARASSAPALGAAPAAAPG